MKRMVAIVAPVVAVLAAYGVGAAPVDAAAKPTSVTVKAFHFYTPDNVSHSVKPGGTYLLCAAQPVANLYAVGQVQRGHKGKSFTELWRRSGKLVSKVNAVWDRNGAFRDFFLVSPGGKGVTAGTWTFTLKSQGKIIGKAKVKVEASPTPC